MKSEKTRLKTLNKLVDDLLQGNDITFSNTIETLHYKQFNPQYFPDPKIDDPLRYALAASIVEQMCYIWSIPPKNIGSVPPDWCANVPAIDTAYWLMPEASKASKNPRFLKRGIHVFENFMFFV